jgi:hypothetical protein
MSPLKEGEEGPKEWNAQVMAYEAAQMARKSTIVGRSPSKGSFPQQIPPAPKKPATRAAIREDDEDEETPSPPTPTPTHASPSIQVPATPLKEITGPSPSIQVPATPSETTIQETQGSSEDPFQATLKAAINMISRNRDKLANPKTTVPQKTKDEVVLELADAISFLEGLYSMKENMDSIKREIREVKETILEVAKAPPTAPINWAAVVATPRIQTQTQTHRPRHRDQEIDEENQKKQAERRLERAKFEITLTAEGAPRVTRDKLSGTGYEQITANLQKVVDESTPPTETPIKIGGFRVLKSNDIRFACESAEEATRLRKLDWTAAYEGLVVRQPKFGIVIHGVSIDEVNPRTDPLDDIASEIGERNNIKVVQLRTLRAPPKLDPKAQHNSFVILTHDQEAADKCMRKGIFLNCRLYNAEKYTPQYQLTQCYKCQRFGHKAGHCRGRERCGKCSKEDHTARECQSHTPRCVNCGDDHAAWHPDCPRRREESDRLDDLKFKTKRAYFND